RLPTGLTTKTDKYPTAEIRVAKQSIDGDAGDLAAPAAAASAAPIPGPPPPNVTVQEVAKGIWHLAGQSHHSVVVEFSDHLTLTVNLYHISGNPHADTLLMAYFPKERILVEADVFNPGAPVSPYAPNLMENIRKHKLQIDRIVPLHATIAPYGDLLKVVTTRTSD